MRTNYTLLILTAMLLSGGMAFSQGTVKDYQRAYSLRTAYSRQQVYYADVRPTWIDGTARCWYVRHTPEGDRYVVVDADARTKQTLFDHPQLAQALTAATGKQVGTDTLRLMRLQVSPGLDTLGFSFAGRRWRYLPKNNQLADKGILPVPPTPRHWMETDDEKDGAPVTSPDGLWTAYIKNSNVYVKSTETGEERQLSLDGTQGNYYSTYIHWSPDSKKVAAMKIRPVEKRYVYYVESSPRDQLQPKLHKQEYAKPGDELPFRVPCIYEVETARAVIPSTDLFNSQFELTELKWDADSRAVTFEYNQRGHQVYRVLELSAETGQVRPLVEETSDKYINYTLYFRHDLADGKRLIWSSERDNWNHLYMYDRQTGQPLRQITKGAWYVRDVQYVDEEHELIYFSANGMVADEDPYLIRYYRIGFDGTGLVCLTPETGMHEAWYSPDMKYMVDTYSLVDAAPVAVLRSTADGHVVMPLEQADITRLEAAGWHAPEVFTAKGRDGVTDMWGVIVRPSNFDPSKTYPVIEYIYQGPGDQYVPKTFTPYDAYMTPLAELGFIVVMVDGMGTSFRSRAFENVCYKNLKDAGLPDHIAWLKAAAARYPYMDLERVGIYGCSAGGQESLNALLTYPDFYKACYSACGCHDNRMDKIWWNELWLGYPVGDAYVEGSNVVNAHLLKRPLMLVVGELDDNVDPASTMQVVNALIKANKDFELVVIPGAHHTAGEAFGEHKRFDFFVRNLIGVNPPRWEDVGE